MGSLAYRPNMAGDYSRLTFQPLRGFAAVLLQQGRVLLDADWNEAEHVRRYRFRTLVRDLVGPAAFAENGFGLSAHGPLLMIGAGHAWIEGLLCELAIDVDAGAQPDFPVSDLPSETGTYVAYLEVWEREVTASEDRTLVDPAFDGPDTSVRLATVAQVRFEPIVGDRPGRTKWSVPASQTDARLVVRGLYQGLENRLYRIEIHDDAEAPTFKWSRDNGSTIAALASWSQQALDLRREDPRLRRGDHLEIIDRVSILHRRPGHFVEITDIQAKRLAILPRADPLPDRLLDPLARRWDGPVAAINAQSGRGIDLGDGIELCFEGSNYRSGDYWLIAARHADESSLTWPDTSDACGSPPRPPHGPEVHRSPIALVHRDESGWTVIRDLRRRLPR
jgi:hypothetical protein